MESHRHVSRVTACHHFARALVAMVAVLAESTMSLRHSAIHMLVARDEFSLARLSQRPVSGAGTQDHCVGPYRHRGLFRAVKPSTMTAGIEMRERVGRRRSGGFVRKHQQPTGDSNEREDDGNNTTNTANSINNTNNINTASTSDTGSINSTASATSGTISANSSASTNSTTNASSTTSAANTNSTANTATCKR